MIYRRFKYHTSYILHQKSNLTQIPRKLVFPDRPVVIAPGCYVELVMDALATEYARHLKIIVFAEIIFRCTQHDIHAMEFSILRIGHEVGWVVEIHIIVVIPAQKRPNVVGRAHREQMTHLLGVPKREV